MLALVLREVDLGALLSALSASDPAWLLLALLLRSGAAGVRALRVGVILARWGRPPMGRVTGLSLLAALVSMLLPARAGDVLAVGLLSREARIPVGRAAAGFVVTAVVTAVLSVLMTLGALGQGLAQWRTLLGASALGTLSKTAVVTLGALLLLAVGIRLAGRAAGRQPGGVRALVSDTSEGFRPDRWLAANVALGAVQLALAVGGLAALLPALGISLQLPLVAMAGFVSMTNLLSAVLPEALGASSAASGLLILSVFGADETEAVAFAAGAWLVRGLPLVILGGPPLLARLGPLRTASG